jgi:hypothetical protein
LCRGWQSLECGGAYIGLGSVRNAELCAGVGRVLNAADLRFNIYKMLKSDLLIKINEEITNQSFFANTDTSIN